MDQHLDPTFIESKGEIFDELVLEMAYLFVWLSKLFRAFLENVRSHFFHILNVFAVD
jgi:hypothetical protein